MNGRPGQNWSGVPGRRDLGDDTEYILLLRAVGTMVVAAIVVVGMPSPPASAAPTDHVTITANTPTDRRGQQWDDGGDVRDRVHRPTSCILVDWATANGTATAGSDYVAAGGTVSFSGARSQRTKTVTVLIDGDTTAEPSETFTVGISNSPSAPNVVIDTPSATQTITTTTVRRRSRSPT